MDFQAVSQARGSRQTVDMPCVTLDQVLEPYKAKDKTVPDKIFAKTKEDAEALDIITVFGMKHILDEGETEHGEGHANRREHTEPPDGSPPTPPRSPLTTALDNPAASCAKAEKETTVPKGKGRAAGAGGPSKRAGGPSMSDPSLISQEMALAPSTMSFPQPGQALLSLPTPDKRDYLEPAEWMREGVDGGEEEAEDGIDWDQEAHSTQAIAHGGLEQDLAEQPEENGNDIDAPARTSPRKIRDPLAFSDHVPSQASSHPGGLAPSGEEDEGDNAAIDMERAISASNVGVVDEDDEDDGLSEYERTHRALPRQDPDADGASSVDDAEDAERESLPVQPDATPHVKSSQTSTQERSFSASQKSTQDRSLSRYSRAPGGTNEVLVENSDETKPKLTPDGSSTTSPESPSRSAGRAGNTSDRQRAKRTSQGKRQVDAAGEQGSSAQQSGSSPVSSGALAYLNPINVVRAVTRAVKSSTQISRTAQAGDDDEDHRGSRGPAELADKSGDDRERGMTSDHDDRAGAGPAIATQVKQSRSSPIKQLKAEDDAAEDEQDEGAQDDGAAYEWPDNFPPPPSPDLLPARYRAASERTDTPGVKVEFSPAIKREPGTDRIFSPVFVKGEAKAEYHTPGPAARAARKTTRGTLRRKRQREELAAAEKVADEQALRLNADVFTQSAVIEQQEAVPAAFTEAEPEPEPESDPRRFDREGKKRKTSPTRPHGEEDQLRTANIHSHHFPAARHVEREADNEIYSVRNDGDIDMAASDDDVEDAFRSLAEGEQLPLLGGFVPDFNISYGVDEEFMEGVWETIEGLRVKAARKLERA